MADQPATTPNETTQLPSVSAGGLAHLATFPEQNPNAVIETDMAGRVTYCNPEAANRFPELLLRANHPLVAGVLDVVADLRSEGRDSGQREVEFNGSVFEQKVCYADLGGTELIRIYSHDVTAHRRAEQALHDLARRVVDAQEDERRRVSRELHDEAGQALAALKISLELLRQEADVDTDTVRTNLDQAIELVDVTRERIRTLAYDLRPPALDALGLSDTLEDYCDQFTARTKLAIDYSGNEIPGLDDAQQICIYRFVQEAVTNAAIHGNPTHVEVSMRLAGHTHAAVRVADDGTGMDVKQVGAPGRTGLGLAGMRERIETLGGQLGVSSSSRGTELVAILPIEATE